MMLSGCYSINFITVHITAELQLFQTISSIFFQSILKLIRSPSSCIQNSFSMSANVIWEYCSLSSIL